jgi:hypothetical protein
LKRCTFLFFILFLAGCAKQEELKVQRSFYYWRSVFKTTGKEKGYLKDLSIQNLYVKFFDVVWDPLQMGAKPVAKVLWSDAPPQNLRITPVVFITNETIQNLDVDGMDSLASNINKLLGSIGSTKKIVLSKEIQIDCDWTTGTKEKYFRLLTALRKHSFFQQKTLSTTIRLHQLKFVSESGVPPVDKGLVMCYNMGNLRHPQTGNSIIETEELKKYIKNLNHYALPVDIALPLFDWYVKFDRNEYAGLVHSFNLPDSFPKQKRMAFEKDTVLNGIEFKKGEWLRYEDSDIETIKQCIYLLNKKLNQKELNVILYHLDENSLKNYTTYELEDLYSSFH